MSLGNILAGVYHGAIECFKGFAPDVFEYHIDRGRGRNYGVSDAIFVKLETNGVGGLSRSQLYQHSNLEGIKENRGFRLDPKLAMQNLTQFHG